MRTGCKEGKGRGLLTAALFYALWPLYEFPRRLFLNLFEKVSGVDRQHTLPSMKRSYSTDLTDLEWKYLEPHVAALSKRGRPRIHATPKILDTVVFYILKSGSCAWRLLPRELPLWKTVYC